MPPKRVITSLRTFFKQQWATDQIVFFAVIILNQILYPNKHMQSRQYCQIRAAEYWQFAVYTLLSGALWLLYRKGVKQEAKRFWMVVNSLL